MKTNARQGLVEERERGQAVVKEFTSAPARVTRSNMRDIVIVVAVLSALLCEVSRTTIVLSLLLLGVGCFFHVITKGILIRNAVLCTDGTYSLVRHPYYLANYLIDSSFCLLSGNMYLVLAYPFLFYWAYGPTVKKEEKVLASIYGKAFFDYCLDTPQLFPNRHSLSNVRRTTNGFSAKRITANELARCVRFCASSLLILLMHWVAEEGLGSLSLLPLKSGYAVLCTLVILLYAASVMIRRSKKTRPSRHVNPATTA